MFDYSISRKDDVTVFSLIGQAKLQTANLFQDALEKITSDPGKQVILDFAQAEYLDSTGIAILIRLKTNLDERSIPVSLKNLSPEINKIFQITRLNDHFKIEK